MLDIGVAQQRKGTTAQRTTQRRKVATGKQDKVNRII